MVIDLADPGTEISEIKQSVMRRTKTNLHGSTFVDQWNLIQYLTDKQMQAMWKEWEVLSETSLNTYTAVTCTCYE